jgi:hypothetical protein
LKRKIEGLNFKEVFQKLLKVLTGSILMAIITYTTLQGLALLLNTQKAIGILLQGSIAGFSGFSFYILFSLLLKLPEPKMIWSSILTQFKKPSGGPSSARFPEARPPQD